MNGDAGAPVIAGGEGSHVLTRDGRRLVDLSMGFGAAFLGHAHPAVAECVRRQAGALWSSGRLATPARERVEGMLAAILPAGMRLAGLCSTGMEAAEFALRVAAAHTGRTEFAAFARSMHGKSAVTAALCWENAALRPGGTHTLPFVDTAGEEEILAALERLLATRRLAALLVEPVQGSNGAHEATPAFYGRALALCHRHGTLCVFDEILTGLWRTGARFHADGLGARPDLLLFGKSMGNGFPVSALAVRKGIAIGAAASPGSTFSGNALALAAIEGTLAAMGGLDMARAVAALDAAVRDAHGALRAAGATPRGRGALWCLELDPRIDGARATRRILDAGMLVTSAGRFVRLLPAATMEPGLLAQCCAGIAGACAAAGR